MLSAGGTARRPLERGSNAAGFVAIKALVVSCAIDDDKPTCRYYFGRPCTRLHTQDYDFDFQKPVSGALSPVFRIELIKRVNSLAA
jgi:hypothetical protein